MATPTHPLITAKYQVLTAVSPTGRIMQLWAKPDGAFPEHIATDYPDPDTCTTLLVCATDNFTEAARSFSANAQVMFTHADAVRSTIHTISSSEDIL